MASEQDDTVFPEEDLDDDDDEEEEEELLSLEEDIDDDDDDNENDDVLPDPDDDDVDATNSASPSTSSPAVTIAVPSSSSIPVATSAATATTTTTIPTTTATTVIATGGTPSPKRHRSEPEEKKPQPLPLDDSRRLFQRLWTDEDEIELLQGFLDYTTSRGSTHHNDTALFYDQIKSKLQLDFNKNQLVEKLRRLKKKYRNVLSKITVNKEFNFKSPHDQATFEISRKIWTNNNDTTPSNTNNNNYNNRFVVEDAVFEDEDPNFKNSILTNFDENLRNSTEKRPRKRSRSRVQPQPQPQPQSQLQSQRVLQSDNYINSSNGGNGGSGGGNVVEETVRNCMSPLFKELMSNAMGFGGRGLGLGFGGLGLGMNAMPLSFGGGGVNLNFGGGGEGVDEKWRKQQILELEVYSKRLELVQDQIKATLEDLRSTGG